MKTKFYIVATVVALALGSCKKQESASGSEAATKPEEVKNFRVEIKAISDKADDFAVYYTEDNTVNFTSEQTVWSGIKAGQTPQDVIFNLREDKIPTAIRLDFGQKKGADQANVTLYNVKFTYYSKTFEFKGSDFFKYYFPNKDIQTKVDDAAGTITFLQSPNSTVTPFYYPTGESANVLLNLVK